MDNEFGFKSAFSSHHFHKSRTKQEKRKRVASFIAIGISILILISGASRLIASSAAHVPKSPIATISPTVIVFPTDIPTQTPIPSPTGFTPSSKPINSKDKKTGLDRAELTIEVQNGSGELGTGSKASAILKELGYHVTGVSNADSFTYESTVLKVKPQKNAYLALLKKDLSVAYKIGSSSATLSASASADAIIIVGKE